MTTLVIQIPCFNEESILARTLADLPRLIDGIDRIVVLVIDDGSIDRTVEVALASGADYVIKHKQNQGLAKAFITGIRTSLALGADIIVNTDADGQYPGKYISDLIQPIYNQKADLVIGDRQVSNNEHFPLYKRLLERLGSWVVRKLSDTTAPDAPSGFRAYSRYAALRLQVYNSYSYTLETLIQAGKEKMALVNLPITTNPAYRPSRLHKGIFHFIWRQGGTILRSYVLYQPLNTFITLGSPFLLVSFILITRFIVLYLTNQSGIARHIQSVSIGGTLGIFGAILVLLGVIGDAIRTNRKVMEELLIHERDKQRIVLPVSEVNGCQFIAKPDPKING